MFYFTIRSASALREEAHASFPMQCNAYRLTTAKADCLYGAKYACGDKMSESFPGGWCPQAIETEPVFIRGERLAAGKSFTTCNCTCCAHCEALLCRSSRSLPPDARMHIAADILERRLSAQIHAVMGADEKIWTRAQNEVTNSDNRGSAKELVTAGWAEECVCEAAGKQWG
eukprot:gb/GEZJ01001610.1/.p2 GENE.gb/GEZJ01001610.1/~~gb/GEZJ01001610.1/.p2  ORF type:complete len:172 (-),score=15.06 gb/GEZJ01001610.1/:1745-2260(-)